VFESLYIINSLILGLAFKNHVPQIKSIQVLLVCSFTDLAGRPTASSYLSKFTVIQN